ncbi:DUF1795 domain-containing protein [Betaproteobacteria bacterium PRO7]|jgi:hypothetical protein|nr:DUF1795 domain-containing protein [Betaproteobacteria bacterium PRO7]
MRRILALTTAALLAGGCAQTTPYWTLTDDANRVVHSTSFQISVSSGWVRTTTPRTYERLDIDGQQRTILLEGMTITRDGVGIHAINVTRRYPDTAFPTLKKKSTATMLPPEVADLYVAELRKRSGLESLTVVSNKPATVDGKPAFQVVMQYKNDDGLRIQIMSYGFVDKTGFYTISYRAPYLYFYQRDFKEFTNLVASFRQSKGAFDPPPEIPAWAKIFT